MYTCTHRSIIYTYHACLYGQRVRDIEHGSFSPLVFSSTGGMGKEAKIVFKILASLASIKKDTPYSIGFVAGSPFRSCDPHFFAFVAHAPTPTMQ